jgi:rfaE bifunctional protein nucleotidyltransferase chain/domain
MNLIDDEIATHIKVWQQQKLNVVFVTGVFDLLHIEHIRFLQKSKAEGDKLIVGIETDARVKSIKGADRPIHNESTRLEQLHALKVVDMVFLLPKKFSSQHDWETVMSNLHPNVYAVSSHSSHLENKRQICQKYGIDFKIVHKHNPSISTSKLIKEIC